MRVVVGMISIWLIGMLAACSSGLPPGNAERGEQLFSGTIVVNDGNTPACASCHAVGVGESPTLGMNLSNIGARAERRVEGLSATEYLRQSIIFPDAHLMGGWQEGIMYRGYAADLTEQQIEDIVAYLLTLRSGDDAGE
jgi:cytochrome c553